MMNDMICKTLKNGIKVYFYRDENMKRVVVSYNVNYGSNGYYDKFYYKGKLYEVPPAVAHFLEHTLIEESKYGNMLHRFKSKSYEVNGLTYPELTSYYFVGIKDTKKSIKELIHMVDDPIFDEDKVERVKSAIIEEVTKNDDSKYRVAYNINKRNLYKNFEAVSESYNALGTRETTESITYEIAKTCYDAYYYDENKFLVIAGNIDIDETFEYLESIYKELSSHPKEMKPFDYSDDFDVRKTYESITKPVDLSHILVTYKFKNDSLKEKIYLDLYIYYFLRMKFGSDTKFVTDLIDKKIIVGGIGSNSDFFKDTLTISFRADVLDKDKFLESLESELNTNGLDIRDYELIKKSLKVKELSKMDYIYTSIKNFPINLDYTNHLFIIDKIDECSFEDVIEYIDSLKFDVKTVTYIEKQ